MPRFAATALVVFISLLSFGCVGSSYTRPLRSEASPSPLDGAPRSNCDQIYGTAFRSNAERDWFYAHCSHWQAFTFTDPVATPTSGGSPSVGAFQPQPLPVTPAPSLVAPPLPAVAPTRPVPDSQTTVNPPQSDNYRAVSMQPGHVLITKGAGGATVNLCDQAADTAPALAGLRQIYCH